MRVCFNILLIMFTVSFAACSTSTSTTNPSTNANAQATLQSISITATVSASLSYQTMLPGPCDDTNASWYESLSATPSTFTCLANGLQLTLDRPITLQDSAPSILFEGAHGAKLLVDNTVAMTAFDLTANACLVLAATPSFVGEYDWKGYLFRLCQNGTWSMLLRKQVVQQGTFPPLSVLAFVLTNQSGEKSLAVNGQSITTFTAFSQPPHFISIGLSGPINSAIKLTHFTYQPFPASSP